MNFTVDIQKLQTQNPINLSEMKSVKKPITPIDFRTACQNFLRPGIDSVIITNITNKQSPNSTFYSLIIKKNKLQITFNRPNTKQTYTYDYQNNEFWINTIKQSPNFEIEFAKRINRIGRDLQTHQAFIFEQTIKGES